MTFQNVSLVALCIYALRAHEKCRYIINVYYFTLRNITLPCNLYRKVSVTEISERLNNNGPRRVNQKLIIPTFGKRPYCKSLSAGLDILFAQYSERRRLLKKIQKALFCYNHQLTAEAALRASLLLGNTTGLPPPAAS